MPLLFYDSFMECPTDEAPFLERNVYRSMSRAYGVDVISGRIGAAWNEGRCLMCPCLYDMPDS